MDKDAKHSQEETDAAMPKKDDIPPEERLTLFRETSIPRRRLMRPTHRNNAVVTSIVKDIVDNAIDSDALPRIHVQKRVCVPDEDLCINEGWCSVCNGGESDAGDLIVYCGMCGIPVHQSCYGIPSIPKGDWHCQRCVALLETSQSPSSMICVICHRYGGAMKPLQRIQRVTTLPEWVHVLCVWWDHDVVVPNMQVMEPLQMVHPPMNNRQRICMLCNRNEGYLIQCHWNQCDCWFHAICARFGDANVIHRHRVDPKEHLGGGFLQVDIEEGQRAAFHGYCPRHATQYFCLDDLPAKLLASELLDDPKLVARVEKIRTSSPDPDIQLAALGKLLVKYAEQTMASIPSQQLLQIFADHLPQIYKTYPSTTIQLHDVLGASWIEKLHATFGRQTEDPFSFCLVCKDPLTQIDHCFYCTHDQRPHLQHWRCISRASMSSSVSRSKKKLKSSKAKPQLPPPETPSKEWPTYGNIVLQCGVCGAPMDTRAVAVSKTSDFQIQPYVETVAIYSHHGRFVNEVSPPTPKPPATTALPPSDRFRVERGLKLVTEVSKLIHQAVAYKQTADEAIYNDMLTQLSSLHEWIKPLDSYAAEKLGQVLETLTKKQGPGMATLKQFVRDYTKLIHAKHLRAQEKAVAEQKKRELDMVLESKRMEREQMDTEADRSLKDQMQKLKKQEKARERKRKLAKTPATAGKSPAGR
ncbi:unnamed protein product [Aphanomyces euteiches]|uniref:PHD-type domain-containing protein n=1 Tax=Aphanomyces euteiches TaxID=100861 RepID=A0A6G0X5U6_9STRA|nr:hypothetical protein Ae201684_008160 [Aphanomyces euteiches]KAH9143204.1 hypothetical protein AeRB84_012781 [Aphanomyces euteiches]